MSNFPIISVGFVNKPPTAINFLSKITSAPKTISIDRKEKIIKFKNKLKFPIFNSFSFFTYLEKSPKFTRSIEKKAKNVPATVIKAIILSFDKIFSF